MFHFCFLLIAFSLLPLILGISFKCGEGSITFDLSLPLTFTASGEEDLTVEWRHLVVEGDVKNCVNKVELYTLHPLTGRRLVATENSSDIDRPVRVSGVDICANLTFRAKIFNRRIRSKVWTAPTQYVPPDYFLDNAKPEYLFFGEVVQVLWNQSMTFSEVFNHCLRQVTLYDDRKSLLRTIYAKDLTSASVELIKNDTQIISLKYQLRTGQRKLRMIQWIDMKIIQGHSFNETSHNHSTDVFIRGYDDQEDDISVTETQTYDVVVIGAAGGGAAAVLLLVLILVGIIKKRKSPWYDPIVENMEMEEMEDNEAVATRNKEIEDDYSTVRDDYYDGSDQSSPHPISRYPSLDQTSRTSIGSSNSESNHHPRRDTSNRYEEIYNSESNHHIRPRKDTSNRYTDMSNSESNHHLRPRGDTSNIYGETSTASQEPHPIYTSPRYTTASGEREDIYPRDSYEPHSIQRDGTPSSTSHPSGDGRTIPSGHGYTPSYRLPTSGDGYTSMQRDGTSPSGPLTIYGDGYVEPSDSDED